MRQKLIELKGEIEELPFIIEDSNTPLSEIDRSSKQISKDIDDLNRTIIWFDLINILAKEMTIYSSILSWEIPCPWGQKELDMAEWLSVSLKHVEYTIQQQQNTHFSQAHVNCSSIQTTIKHALTNLKDQKS